MRLPDVLERFADNVLAAGGHVHWAADARRRQRLHHRPRPRAGRPHGREGQVDGDRGDRPQRGARGRRASRSSRPTSASGSSSWPTRRRATSSPRPCTSTATRSATSCSRTPGPTAQLDTVPEHLAAFAREQLRARFLAADIGVTGCNFGVAETGSVVLVENEGNGRLSTTVPRVHVAVMGMERVVDTWDQLDLHDQPAGPIRHRPAPLDLHQHRHRAAPRGRGRRARRAARRHPRQRPQRGPRHRAAGDPRAASAAAPASTCAPCTARSAGTPTAGCTADRSGRCSRRCWPSNHPEAAELPNASTLCGACMDACPVSIPLQDLLLTAAAAQRRGRRAVASRPAGRRGPRRGAARSPTGPR